ncbi:MAG: hypothetical protein ACHREM_18390, partial [Polyangiales bacterium]
RRSRRDESASRVMTPSPQPEATSQEREPDEELAGYRAMAVAAPPFELGTKMVAVTLDGVRPWAYSRAQFVLDDDGISLRGRAQLSRASWVVLLAWTALLLFGVGLGVATQHGRLAGGSLIQLVFLPLHLLGLAVLQRARLVWRDVTELVLDRSRSRLAIIVARRHWWRRTPAHYAFTLELAPPALENIVALLVAHVPHALKTKADLVADVERKTEHLALKLTGAVAFVAFVAYLIFG